MQSFREKLPAFSMREEFLKAVAANQVSCLQCLFYFAVAPMLYFCCCIHDLNVLSVQLVVYSLSSQHLPFYALLFLVVICFPFVQKVICELMDIITQLTCEIICELMDIIT